MTGQPVDNGLGSWPERRARMEPDAVALTHGGRQVTYRQLRDRSAALASAFAALAVAGNRVAYLGPNAIATFETLFAAACLGAIFVPLNTRLAAPEIAYMLDDSDPAVLVVAPELEQLAAAALTCSSTAVQVLHLQAGSGAGYEAAIQEHAGRLPARVGVALSDPALILYTSGTTGRPKGAVLTHGNLTWNTLNQFAHFNISRAEVSLCTAPLFHVLGLGQITLPTLFAGGTVVVIPKFDPGSFLATIAAERATAFPLAPTMLQMLCEHPDWDATDMSSVRCVAYGGSPVQERVAKAWLARGIQVLQGYGMTEASPGCSWHWITGPSTAPCPWVSRTSSPTPLCSPMTVALSAGPGRENCLSAGRTCSAATGTGRTHRWTPSMKVGSGAATSCASTRTAGPTSSAGSRT